MADEEARAAALELVRDTVVRYEMVSDGDRIGVGMSGGADSLALLDLLREVVAAIPVDAVLVPVHIRQYSQVATGLVGSFVQQRYGMELFVRDSPTQDVADRLLAAGKAPCRACSRIRARELADLAGKLELDSIALGHHLTDAMATLLMNMWHRGSIETMRPVTIRRKGGSVRIVRPLYFIPETMVKACSPVGVDGITDCGMCSTHADERDVNSAFVNEMIRRHAGTEQRLTELLRAIEPTKWRHGLSGRE